MKVDAGWGAGRRTLVRLVIQGGNELQQRTGEGRVLKRQDGRESFIGWEGRARAGSARFATLTTQRADQRWEWKPRALAGIPLRRGGNKRQRTALEPAAREVRQDRTRADRGRVRGQQGCLAGRAYHVGRGAPQLG
jgi:hypothetical protein